MDQISCKQDASQYIGRESYVLASWPRYQAGQLLHATCGLGRGGCGKRTYLRHIECQLM
jgi:hypothetical protein